MLRITVWLLIHSHRQRYLQRVICSVDEVLHLRYEMCNPTTTTRRNTMPCLTKLTVLSLRDWLSSPWLEVVLVLASVICGAIVGA